MSNRTISYQQAINLAIEDAETVAYLTEAIENHKNWGQFMMKLPSWALVNLVERIKELAEQQLGDKLPLVVDAEEFSDELEE